MSFSTWLAFALGCVIICGSPGPNMLQVMHSAATYGLRRAVFTMAGCFAPVFLMIAASIAGVGLLIKAFPMFFTVLCYAGAAYLVYLGIGAWRAPVADKTDDNDTDTDTRGWHIFTKGLMVGLSNPKAMLFATAFFPQFVNPDAPAGPQFAILLGTFSVAEVSWYLIYAFGGSVLSRIMKRAKIQRMFNRLTGTLFIGFGVAMLAKSR